MFFSDNIWRIGKKSIYLHPSIKENIENYVIPMNQRFLILLMVLMSSLRVWADNTVVLHGDVTHDGAITEQDAKLLVEMVLQSKPQQMWRVLDGRVAYRTISLGTVNTDPLCGDMDHNGQLDIVDVIKLIELVKDPSKAERVGVMGGKITFMNTGGINFNPEDGGFIDDGVIEF